MENNLGNGKERQKLRRWIYKAVSDNKDKNGVTFRHIKKFLDSKDQGVSEKPEIKLILKRAVDKGELLKIDGKYTVREAARRRRRRSRKSGGKVSRRRRRSRSPKRRRSKRRSSKRRSGGRRRSRRRKRRTAAAEEE